MTMSTPGQLNRRPEPSTAEPAKKDHAAGSPGCFAWKEMWSVVRKLTPAEGLALVCLTSWLREETGLVQASDRQVCNQTGVSRDVMKRLRRKLGATGIQVTPGDNLSHDSCSYDFRKVLNRGARRQPPPLPEHVARPAPGLGAKGTDGVGAKSTEPWAQNALPWQSPPPNTGPPAKPESWPTPPSELMSCGPTVEIGYADFEFEVDLPDEWDDDLDGPVDARWTLRAVAPEERPLLPPYEQWLARR
jgi:hypothetical protein